MKKLIRIVAVLLTISLATQCTPVQAITMQEAMELSEPYKSKECGESVETDHGNTLEEVAAGIADLPYETIAAFCTSCGNKLAEYTNYNAGKVDTTKEQMPFRYTGKSGYTELHNHPSRNCSFSPADIKSAAYGKADCMIVVGRWNVFILRPGKKGWPSAKKAYTTAYSNNLKSMALAKSEQKEAEAAGKKFDFYFKASNRAVRWTSKQLGLEYTVIPRGKDGSISLVSNGEKPTKVYQ